MKAQDIVDFIIQIAPHKAGVPNDSQSGWKFGDPQQEVTTVTVSWSPTLGIIEKSIKLGANMIVAHEPLVFSFIDTPWYKNDLEEDKIVNRRRLQLLREHHMCVYGSHSNWDVKEGIGVVDSFAQVLGLDREIGRGYLTRVYEVEPVSVEDLAERVKECLKLKAVRVVADLNRKITKVGTAIGGLGQSFNLPEELHRLGAAVGIFGEMLDYTIRHAIELNLAVIEAGHLATENPGIRNLAKALEDRFPDLRVVFLDTGIPWVYV